MKKENPEDIKNPENPPAPGTPAKPRKEKKEKPKKEKKPLPVNDVHLPVLVELTYSISVLLLILVGLSVVIVSVLTGASLLNLVLRTSAAMLAMGCLLVVIFYQVSSGSLQASLAEQEESQKKSAEEIEIPEAQANSETHSKAEA
jgi:outer membrane biosynthesis protein TonB